MVRSLEMGLLTTPIFKWSVIINKERDLQWGRTLIREDFKINFSS